MGLGYIVVFIFLLEGVIGKANVSGFSIPTSIHLGITGGLIAVIAFIHPSYQEFNNGMYLINNQCNRIRSIIVSLILVGFVSSLIQLNYIPNLIFWLVWSANLFIMFWAIPRLLATYDVPEQINLAAIVLAISLVGGLFYSGVVQNRSGGIYTNPTTHARLLVLSYILMFSSYLSRTRMSKITLVSGLLALPMLIMTATRASIFAMAMTSTLMAGHVITSNYTKQIKSKAVKILLIGVIGGAVIIGYINSIDSIERVKHFLRIDASTDEIYESARAMNWEASLNDFPEYGLLGWGFLSKFGVTDENLMKGFSLPKYDWTSANDPLNMLLSTAKMQGWLGLFVFSLLIAAIWKAAINRRDLYQKYIAMSVLFTGMVWGLADGNWLTTFGDPVDRLSMYILAVVLCRPRRVC